jgi:xanthine dehydrogenase accessory factor
MERHMSDFVAVLKNVMDNNVPVCYITVTDSEGSVPRKQGAFMLVSAAGRIFGTIGGGIAEYSAIQEGISLIARGEDLQKKYILHPADSSDLDAVCGGEIDVHFEYLAGSGLKIKKLIADIIAEEDARGSVYIFGGGHVAQELVPVLHKLDFRCVIFEDRPEFTDPALFPYAADIVLGSFSDIQKSITLKANDYVVVLTRGHRFDYDSMCFALKSPARYIGVIGSHAKHEFVRNRLVNEAGFTRSFINEPRVHAPIGIVMHCETPAEIAISIAAELINVRFETSGPV